MDGRDWERWDEPEVARKIDDGWHCPEELNYRSWLAHKLVEEGLQPTDRVLEVGCGTGLFYDALRKYTSAAYVGVDSSVEMLRIAQARFPGIDFQRGDGFRLEWPAATFYAVLAIDVLQHLPDIVPFIRELVRVSRGVSAFTLYAAPASEKGQEVINGQAFLRYRYSMEDARRKVHDAVGEIDVTTHVIEFNGGNLWILRKASPGVAR